METEWGAAWVAGSAGYWTRCPPHILPPSNFDENNPVAISNPVYLISDLYIYGGFTVYRILFTFLPPILTPAMSSRSFVHFCPQQKQIQGQDIHWSHFFLWMSAQSVFSFPIFTAVLWFQYRFATCLLPLAFTGNGKVLRLGDQVAEWQSTQLMATIVLRLIHDSSSLFDEGVTSLITFMGLCGLGYLALEFLFCNLISCNMSTTPPYFTTLNVFFF